MFIKSITLIAVLVICFACNNQQPAEKDSASSSAQPKAEDKTYHNGFIDEFEQNTTDSADAPPQPQSKQKYEPLPTAGENWDKKIVKTAEMRAEVKDYKKFSQELSELVRTAGGYISGEQQTQSTYKIENSVTIKIPVDRFETTVNALAEKSLRVDEKQVGSEDVTTQLIDGRSRLEAKKQVRLRYLDLLRQARNMEEILTVQKEINEIQEEIELVGGRITGLQHAASMSTIHFSFYQVLDAEAGESMREAGFAEKLKMAFSNGWYWIKTLLITLVSIWPILLTAIFVLLWMRKKRFFTPPKA